MAQNVQNVTLALTLPISCHICLGKVRQPVICVNHHVFCSSCIDLWLKNNNHCPACRVPITPDNPCKDIIGGISENENIPSHSMRKHLRKTRLELLQKDYEDEIESLTREIEELRRTNLTLEERLNTFSDPVTESSSCNCGNTQAEERSNICNKLIEDWNRKLEMINAANKSVTEDITRLKEENRRLKNENVEFVRENLRLKNEVELRSPQKFGRFTVAALQAKVDQYEREMSRLKKALERSDQYIEELEAQIVQLKKPPEDKQIEKSQCGNTALMEEHAGRAATSYACQDFSTAQMFPNHSKDDGIYSDDSKGLCPISAGFKKMQSKTVSSPQLKNGLHAAMWNGGEQSSLDIDSPMKATVSMPKDLGSPSCLPFSSLQLNTPDKCKSSSDNNTSLKKPLTYLRRLVFDDLPQRRQLGKVAPSGNEHNENESNETIQSREPYAVFSNICHNNEIPQEKNSEEKDSQQFIKQGTSAEAQIVSRLHTRSAEVHSETSHENSTDANLHNNDDPSITISHLASQKSKAHHTTPDLVRHLYSDSSVHTGKSPKKTTLSNHESSQRTFSVCNSLSSATDNEQAHSSMAQSSTDRAIPCVPLQSDEHVRLPSDTEMIIPPQRIAEPVCPSSSISQNVSGSPPAKKKAVEPME
ncbi:ORC ubiquitin ligase 1 [Pyxicephalus adspersus]|uniref:RING-type domain-containing protein n=1 Tax=Pyxicephalus adspersus TaxID=30357 RepID=A0AAV3B5Y5_PYXAD|nr:TPA: hypothetical protein GDO54_000798 [Pyxicephalus adspersus]